MIVDCLTIYEFLFLWDMVQLKGNLMPALGLTGEKVRVNLTGVGAGARNVLHQPSGHPF